MLWCIKDIDWLKWLDKYVILHLTKKKEKKKHSY